MQPTLRKAGALNASYIRRLGTKIGKSRGSFAASTPVKEWLDHHAMPSYYADALKELGLETLGTAAKLREFLVDDVKKKLEEKEQLNYESFSTFKEAFEDIAGSLDDNPLNALDNAEPFNLFEYLKSLKLPKTPRDETKTKSKSDLASKFRYANIEKLPLSVDKKYFDFYRGEFFERDALDEQSFYASISQKSTDPPTFVNKDLADALPRKPHEGGHFVFPLVQVSGAGKTFAIRNLAKKRHVLLIDLKATAGQALQSQNRAVATVIKLCDQFCSSRDDKIEKITKESDLKTHWEQLIDIHRECFDNCSVLMQYLFCSNVIAYLYLLHEDGGAKMTNIELFDTFNNVKYNLLKVKVFEQILQFDTNDIMNQLLNEMSNEQNENMDCPVLAIDECGVLMDFVSPKHNSFMSRALFNELSNSSDNAKQKVLDVNGNIKKDYRRSLYDCMAQGLGYFAAGCGLPFILAGTTMKLYKLVEGYASPFKPSEMIVCRPLLPLSTQNVKFIINEYLNIDDFPDDLAEYFTGRPGILINKLIDPFLKSFDKASSKEDWREQFITLARTSKKNKVVEDYIIRFVKIEDLWDDYSMFINQNIKHTLGYGLCCLYYNLLFSTPDDKEETKLPGPGGLPHLIDNGIVYVNKFYAGQFYASVIEPAGVSALESLFRPKPKEGDLFWQLMMSRLWTAPVVKGYEFERIVAYGLIKCFNKRLDEVPFMKEFLKKNPEYAGWIFVGNRYMRGKEKDNRDFKSMLDLDEKMEQFWMQTKGYATDLTGMIKNPKTNEKEIFIVQSKCLTGHVLQESRSGLASLMYEMNEFSDKVTVPTHFKTQSESQFKKDGLLVDLRYTNRYIGLFVTQSSQGMDDIWNLHEDVEKFLHKKQDEYLPDSTKRKHKIFHVHFGDICNSL